MINSKDATKAEMADLEKIILMYKEAFPDNPAFAVGGKKKEKGKKPKQQDVPAAEATKPTAQEE